jgi:hypothetical protein
MSPAMNVTFGASVVSITATTLFTPPSRWGLDEAVPSAHRCSGCGHRWEGPLTGAELCGDCWRKGQAVIHGEAVVTDWTPTDVTAALEDLAFARESHLAWAEHLEAHATSGVPCEQCEGKPYKLHAEHEREWVAKYDRIIAIVRASQSETTRFAWLMERRLAQDSGGLRSVPAGTLVYWDGGHAESFTIDPHKAVQWPTKEAARTHCPAEHYDQWGWQIVEHGFIGEAVHSAGSCVDDRHVFLSPDKKGRCMCGGWLIAIAEAEAVPSAGAPSWLRAKELKDYCDKYGRQAEAVPSAGASEPRNGRMPPCVCGHGWPMHVIPGGVENIDVYPTERHCVDCACRNYRREGSEVTAQELLVALKAVTQTDDDCPVCDRGRLRNPQKTHWPECPFGRAQALIARAEAPRPASPPEVRASRETDEHD